MASTPEHTTLICLFHHTDRAERTVQELLEIGVAESAMTLLGHARETTDIETGTATLETLGVPQRDRARLMDGLRAGGSILAVAAEPVLVPKIEAIFDEYNADKIDEEVHTVDEGMGTGLDGLGTVGGGTGFAAGSGAFAPPVLAAGTETEVVGPVEEILLITEPTLASSGEPEIVQKEETLVLLEPTDLVEDTDLVEPPSGSSVDEQNAGLRFDPNAPLDDVRNPAADPLNDPRNRR